MPRYFFHQYDETDVFDPAGNELADFETAVVFALRNAREIAAAEIQNGKLNLNHRIDVTDEDGWLLTSVPFSEVVDRVH